MASDKCKITEEEKKTIDLKTRSGQSCWSCEKPDDDWMIQCDSCERWNHHACVGVTEAEAKEVDYVCVNCETRRRQSISDDITANEEKVTAKYSDEALKKANEAVRRMERETVQQRSAFEAKIQEMEKAHREANALHEKQMQEMRNFMLNLKERRTEDELKEPTSDEKYVFPDPAQQQVLKQLSEMQQQIVAIKCSIESADDGAKKSKVGSVKDASAPTGLSSLRRPVYTNEKQNGTEKVIERLAMKLSRQQIQKLPEFRGDPKEWAYFESVFNSTTKEGCYSEEQNVKRLRQSLTSRAFEYVQEQLMFSSNATSIMNDLREAFGKPEVVIVTMLQELVDMPQLPNQDKNISTFAIKVKKYVAQVKAMNLEKELDHEYTLVKLAGKLDSVCLREWRELKLKQPYANIAQFSSFLMERLTLTSSFALCATDSQSEARSKITRPGGKLMAHREDSSSSTDVSCLICEKPHRTSKCFRITRGDETARNELARNHRLCLICYSPDHFSRSCPNKGKANRSSRVTSRMFTPGSNEKPKAFVKGHPEDQQGQQSVTKFQDRRSHPAPQEPNGGQLSSAHVSTHISPQYGIRDTGFFNLQAAHSEPSSEVLMKIVPVKILGNNTTSVVTYAFLDGGSTVTLLEEELFHQLELDGGRRNLVLQWTKGITRSEDSFFTSLNLMGVTNRQVHKLRNVNTVKELLLPEQTVNVFELKSRFPHLRDLPLVDMVRARPRMLIGLKHSMLIAEDKTRRGDEEDPVAAKTPLGWIVYGLSAPSLNVLAVNIEAPQSVNYMVEPRNLDEETHQMVKKYFSTESFGVVASSSGSAAITTAEERRAQEIIDKTMRMVNNRMEIGLLWKHDNVTLPDSYPMAMNRLRCQEKSLAGKPELLEWVNSHIKEMLQKGHARVANEDELRKPWKRVAYIPTFTVINPNKIPPKPRFVMDFAAKSGADGKSVNSELLRGPDNLASLVGALCKFREGKIAVNADVKEMFHQVLIKEEDQQCQRFLWRDGDNNSKPTIYILQVMAFGPTCSPAAAQAVKNVNAEKFRDVDPEAVESIIKHTYVDDYFNSHENVAEAVRVTKDAIKIFDNISNKLVGVQSNSKEFLPEMPLENVNQRLVSMDPDENQSDIAKVLGMYWDPNDDMFTFKLFTNHLIPKMLERDFRPTKRMVLSVLMKVFDSLGLISHYMIRAKILLQEIWRDGTKWDEPIEERLMGAWLEFIRELLNIEKLKIPRQYAPVNSAL